MKKKKVFRGWISKMMIFPPKWRLEELNLPTIWRTKGRKEIWAEEEWPPHKVKITFEWEE